MLKKFKAKNNSICYEIIILNHVSPVGLKTTQDNAEPI